MSGYEHGCLLSFYFILDFTTTIRIRRGAQRLLVYMIFLLIQELIIYLPRLVTNDVTSAKNRLQLLMSRLLLTLDDIKSS